MGYYVRIVVEEYPVYGECPFGVDGRSEEDFPISICTLPCAEGAHCKGCECPYLVSLEEIK